MRREEHSPVRRWAERSSGGGMPIMPPPTYLAFYRPLRPSGTSPSPDVRLGSLTLMTHKMTFSHYSKGFIRPNLGEESGVWLTFRFQVSSSHPLCPSESGGRGATLRRGYDKRKCENGNVKGVVSLQTVIAICTLSPVSVLCPNRKRPQKPVVQVIIQSSLVSWQEI